MQRPIPIDEPALRLIGINERFGDLDMRLAGTHNVTEDGFVFRVRIKLEMIFAGEIVLRISAGFGICTVNPDEIEILVVYRYDALQLVDDEEHILKALTRILGKNGFEVHAFTDVEEALSALGEHRYAVMMVDYQIPKINGVTYLQFAKQSQPDAMRVVLSAIIVSSSDNVFRMGKLPADLRSIR